MTSRPSAVDRSFDEAALARRINGDRSVYLTKYERREAVRRLHALGLNDRPIAHRLGISDRTVLRIRGHLSLPAIAPHKDRDPGDWRESA